MNKNEKLPYCECGCGNRVKKYGNRFINGHNKCKKPEIDIWIEENTNKYLCECGCGDYVIIKRYYYHNKKIPKYIDGHQCVGRIISEEENKKRKNSWTDDMKDAARERGIIMASDDEFIEYIRACAIEQFSSSESRKEMSEIKIQYYKDHPEAREAARIRAINQKHNTCNTSIELKMQDILMSHGYIFELQQPCCNICRPDIIFQKYKITIFCDGDYWHNYPESNDKDKNQDKVLLANGWLPLRFWEHEINDNIEDCLYRFELEYYKIKYSGNIKWK